MVGFTEEVLTFGNDGHLVGLLTVNDRAAPRRYSEGSAARRTGFMDGSGRRSDGGEAGPGGGAQRRRDRESLSDSTGLIFLNAGVLHRVGPHRLHVTLARHFVRRGLPSLRMDVSGVGDSRVARGDRHFEQQAVADVRQAMDLMNARTGTQRFVLFGLCSGADNAFATALEDERVRGLVLLDPISYVTHRARIRHILQRVRHAGGVAAAIRWGASHIRDRLHREATEAERELPADDSGERQQGRAVPPKDEYSERLLRLVRRGVDILAIFTGSLRQRYNHPDQFFECFPQLRGTMECRYFPRVDHTFTELQAQHALRSTLEEWLERPPQRRRGRA